MPELNPQDGWTCDRVLGVASEWLRGELAPAMTRAVSRHVERCERCAQQLRAHERYHARLRRVASGERAPEPLRARIVEALRRPRPPRG